MAPAGTRDPRALNHRHGLSFFSFPRSPRSSYRPDNEISEIDRHRHRHRDHLPQLLSPWWKVILCFNAGTHNAVGTAIPPPKKKRRKTKINEQPTKGVNQRAKASRLAYITTASSVFTFVRNPSRVRKLFSHATWPAPERTPLTHSLFLFLLLLYFTSGRRRRAY